MNGLLRCSMVQQSMQLLSMVLGNYSRSVKMTQATFVSDSSDIFRKVQMLWRVWQVFNKRKHKNYFKGDLSWLGQTFTSAQNIQLLKD